MKLIKTEDAVGHVLCHDITQIIKGVTKDALFRKGHIVTEEDIPLLLSVGKEHLYVWENDESMMHENDAAMVLLDMCKNDYMSYGEIKEGKIELKSEIHGLFKVDRKALFTVNSFGQMMIATRHSNTVVNLGDKLAGMRIIPLVIEKEKMKKVSFYTLGCKVNQYETNAMIQKMIEAGYEVVDFETKADIYIINTCTVTNMADKK